MKNEFPKLAYQDQEFEDITRIELEQAKKALQKLLDVWNELKLSKLTETLFKLAFDPKGVYSKALGVESLPVIQYNIVPGVKIQDTGPLVPDQLFRAAREARIQTQVGRHLLWSVSADGKTVILDEALSTQLIESHNIIAQNQVQFDFVRDVVEYVEISNRLNAKLTGIQTLRMPAVPFTLVSRSFPLIQSLELQPEQLRDVITEI